VWVNKITEYVISLFTHLKYRNVNFLREESRTLEDLLFILSEHVLSKPAQYLLQYLITKLNIHIKHPETLLFITLPYYQARLAFIYEMVHKGFNYLLTLCFQFEIFNKIVGCLPVKKTTRWFQNKYQDYCYKTPNFFQ